MRIVVLGGTGFLGSVVAGHLARAHDVVAVGLPGSRAGGPPAGRLVETDLLADPNAAATVLLGADAVVYALAPAGPRGGSGRLVTAAESLATAAAAVGVRHWVHLSNVSVYGSAEGWVDDSTAAAPDFELGFTTVRMEQATRHTLAEAGAATTFLRLGPVFADDATLTGVSASYVDPGCNWQSYVCRPDVATAVALALAGRLPEFCVVSDGAPVRTAQAARIAALRRGVAARPVPRETALRFGENSFGVLNSSVRARPVALRAAGWRPTVRLSEARR